MTASAPSTTFAQGPTSRPSQWTMFRPFDGPRDRMTISWPRAPRPPASLDLGDAGVEHAKPERKIGVVDLIVRPGALRHTDRQRLANEPASYQHVDGILDTLLGFRRDSRVPGAPASGGAEDPGIAADIGELFP